MALILHGYRYSVYVRIARIALAENDEAFPGRTLQPTEPRHRARMAQIISVIDSYGYGSMVRQVAGERVFAPLRGRQPDEALIRTGLAASRRVLDALETIIPGDGPIAGGKVWSLADFHLAPMMSCFTAAPEGNEALTHHAKLSAWWQMVCERNSVREADSGLPTARPSLPQCQVT
jgi:glutathione S-transferase